METLSDRQKKVGRNNSDFIGYSEEDVKEFIGQLEEEMFNNVQFISFEEEHRFENFIDKLAGDKLL